MHLSGVVLALALAAMAADEPLRPDKAIHWQPPVFDEAVLHPRIAFLEPERAWERMDIWVPKRPAEGPLPCVVVVYGGGYGEKNFPAKDWRPLLSRGYVVAAPDYALKTCTPVPLCAWDVADAIRFLRAHAATYRIDPERVGLWGWSAGGWIAQDLCYAGPERVVTARWKDPDNRKVAGLFPMRRPRPLYAEHSVCIQAVATDWGAGKLWDKRTRQPVPWLSADDPPLVTCYQGGLADDTVNPVVLLQRLGVPARGLYGFTVNTHVPGLESPCVHEDGRRTTWGEAIYAFFGERLKGIDTATAPEMRPHGGPIDGPTPVRLLTVHPTGTIHYTRDGSEPTAGSPAAAAPVQVQPGETLKAIVVRPGLRPSRVTTGTFERGPPRPGITTRTRAFRATVGRPFRVQFEADRSEGTTWYAGGMLGDSFRTYGGKRFNPPRHIPWMHMDPQTGVLSGTPRWPGVYPVIISCVAEGPGPLPREPRRALDAVRVVVCVDETLREGG
jgi:acetyl esterase/lipase